MSATTASTSTLRLVRSWAVDWLASHDPVAAAGILADNYRLTIGSVVLEGRGDYIDATVKQLNKFPGLCLTVHDVLVNGDLAAVRFTEHGAATHREGRAAAWRGVCLFRVADDRIVECWAEEDYASRSAQLLSGHPATPEPPAVAPWDTISMPPEDDAERAVRTWLKEPSVDGVLLDDGETGAPALGEIAPTVLLCSGTAVAFHGRSAMNGYDLGVAGMLRADSSGGVSGHIVTDRAGWAAHLRKRSA